MLFWATNYCGVEVAVCCDLLGIFTCVLYHLGLVDSGGKKNYAKKNCFYLIAFEFGDSQFRDVSSSGIPDRYVDKKKGHFNRIWQAYQ